MENRKRSNADLPPSIDKEVQNLVVSPLPNQPRHRSSIRSYGSSNFASFSHDEKVIKTEFLNYIIRADLPLSFMEEYHDFTKTIQTVINPQFKGFSVSSMEKGVKDRFFNERDELKRFFANFDGRICLSSDIWTSYHSMEYLCLTAHYIDNDWNLCKRIISFSMIEPPNDGYNVGEAILEVLREWDIVDKVFSFTFDNASNNDIASLFLGQNLCSPLGNDFCIRCCAHTLNIMVQDGLSVLFNSISKLRNIVCSLNSSISKRELYFKCCKQLHLKERIITIDQPNLWVSTFEMLDLAIEYKGALNLFCIELSNSSQYITLEQLNEVDWTNVPIIREFFRVFDKSMKDFCYVYTPSICHVIRNLLNICHLFNTYSNIDTLRPMVEKMKEIFNKYFNDMYITFLLGLFFDPRYKNQYFDVCLKFIFDDDIEKVNDVISSFDHKLHELYDHYYEHHATSTCNSISTTSTSDVFMMLHKKKIEALPDSKYLQLKYYIDSPLVPLEISQSFDILGWWKLHGKYNPVLSIMARDILTMSVSTVESELAFNAGGRVISAARSSSRPPTVEALICLKDWELADTRMHEDAKSEMLNEAMKKLYVQLDSDDEDDDSI